MTVMNIEIEETKIYQTKTKTNFALCFQLVKPEEYLMRHSWSLQDKIERKIKAKCRKIMELEIRGANWKKEELMKRSIQNKFRGNLISHRDRNSLNPKLNISNNEGRPTGKSDNLEDRRRFNSMHLDSHDPFYFGSDRKEPLLEGGGKFEDNLKDLKIDDMNVSQILNYTAVRKMSYDESIFSMTMMKRDPTKDLKTDKQDGEEGVVHETAL